MNRQKQPSVLLIHPPVAKPAEPPAGITRLAGALRGNNIACQLLDASVEGILYLLNSPLPADDTWSLRAIRNRAANIEALRSPGHYQNRDRYRRAVADLNRLLEIYGNDRNLTLSFSNYQDHELSPLKSSDLLRVAKKFENNIFYPYFSERLRQLIAGNLPEMIGVSLNYLSQAQTTFAMVGFLKTNYPDLPIVMGGGLVTSWLSNLDWQNPFEELVDHLIAGPGEGPLLKLLGVEPGPSLLPPDLTDLPLDQYLSPGLILPYGAASGCYWNRCSFCPEKAENNPYLPLGNKRVRKELAGLIDHTKPALIHFLDNAISPSLLKDLAADPPGVNWYGFCRFEKLLADPEFCHSLKKSGCVMIKLGLESGDQTVLDKLDKGINLKMVSIILNNLNAAGIATYIYLLFGTPAEDYAAARRTLDFVVDHHDCITFLNLAIFNMPIESPEAGHFAVRNSYDGDLSLYTEFQHPAGWNRKEVRSFLDREFKRHPIIAEIIRNDPPLFTSNHAPFFC
ncbi:MAG: radical SAM protein [Proteobacteria bacterium]|nr:radical SAM protein [Pseudomonadota bacterium]MBU1736779.1 radical SAM protein [Pseudomonadota bacterium]